MKKNIIKKSALLMLTLVMLTGFSANAQKKFKKQDKRCFGKLELTDAQKEKMKAIRLSFMKEITPLKNELGEKKAKMKTLTSVEKANKSKVYDVIEDIAKIKAQIAKKHFDKTEKIKEILTDEQRTIFISQQCRRKGHKFGKHKRHRKFKGHRRGGRKGGKGQFRGYNNESPTFNEKDVDNGVEYGDIIYDNNPVLED